METQTDYSMAYEQSNLNLKREAIIVAQKCTAEKALTQILKVTDTHTK